jgi:hypothetical protein
MRRDGGAELAADVVDVLERLDVLLDAFLLGLENLDRLQLRLDVEPLLVGRVSVLVVGLLVDGLVRLDVFADRLLDRDLALLEPIHSVLR